MKKIQMNKETTGYIDDCRTIKQKAEQFGYKITIEQAYLLWLNYSGCRCAGWLTLPQFDTKQECKTYCEQRKTFFNEYDDTWEDIFTDDCLGYLGFNVYDEE